MNCLSPTDWRRLPRILDNNQFFRQLRLFQHLSPVDIDRRERELVFGQFRRQHREHRRFRAAPALLPAPVRLPSSSSSESSSAPSTSAPSSSSPSTSGPDISGNYDTDDGNTDPTGGSSSSSGTPSDASSSTKPPQRRYIRRNRGKTRAPAAPLPPRLPAAPGNPLPRTARPGIIPAVRRPTMTDRGIKGWSS